MSRRLGPSLGLLLTLVVVPMASADAPQPPVRLAVLVVFDQLRADYLERWNDLFGADGFHRIEKEGAWFQNCNYPYSHTVTGAGHASLATGCPPRVHGIIENEWYDRGAGGMVYCATQPRYADVPPSATKSKAGSEEVGGSPRRLMAPTLADALKEATDGNAKVVSLSFKDRGAILPGGRRRDVVACWLNSATGLVGTSTYYRDRLPAWAEEFNTRRPADAWVGRSWERLRPELDYAARSGPDDQVGEGGKGLTRVFPHALGTGKADRAYYSALYLSPFGNEVLLELAKSAIDGEELGRHETPDLLCLSFSCNDSVGHAWGPDSQEVLDITLRSDLIVRDLLQHLDRTVGKGKYTLVVSADHGVCPLPEVEKARRPDACRVDPRPLVKAAAEELRQHFHAAANTRVFEEGDAEADELYLNKAWMKADGLASAEVEKHLADWLKQQPDVLTAFTRTELLRDTPPDDAIGGRVWQSFFAERSGDVSTVFKPYHLVTTSKTGTTHGTPHAYDTHVPLLVFGPGIAPGVRGDAVTPLAAAPILARALGVKPPAGCKAAVPERLFRAE